MEPRRKGTEECPGTEGVRHVRRVSPATEGGNVGGPGTRARGHLPTCSVNLTQSPPASAQLSPVTVTGGHETPSWAEAPTVTQETPL